MGVKTLIRVGTAGGMGENVKVRDVVLAQGSSTDSSIILNTFGAGLYFAPLADFNLLREAANLADTSAIRYHVGNVLGEDRFYNDEMDRQNSLIMKCWRLRWKRWHFIYLRLSTMCTRYRSSRFQITWLQVKKPQPKSDRPALMT